ncbi:MAG TPA: hypothetical protein VMU11_00635 [Verrucomicrobiae bacterium]|nr:hypothetical protein [Verrucomicrobiae bacterium]
MSNLLSTILVVLALFLFARYFGGMGIGAPWLPVRKQDIKAAFDLVDVGANDLVIDLGSGDGRLLVAAAEKGAAVAGYELNPILCFISWLRLKRFGDRAVVHRRNLLKADVSRASVIFIFGMEWIMPLVSEKLKREARREVKIVSFAFELPGLIETKKVGIARLYELP